MREILLDDILRYYVCYKDIELKILNDFKSFNSMEEKLVPFNQYLSHMKIARNFNEDKLKLLINTAEIFNDNNKIDVEGLNIEWQKLKVFNKKINNAKVAASKVLWLFDKSRIIMDNYNRTVLQLKDSDDFNKYSKKWKIEYEKYSPQIDLLIEKMLKYNVGFDGFIKEEWFKMRVFDQYLWTIYVNEK